ncbi:MAG: 4-hydroxy-tetrahydrodipicolinate reductase [Clostridia bacterium]|nr:4-hydroxy-tetrahydrodipicolinate reductase [Clostridia bacterium]
MRIIVNGACGRMGREVIRLATEAGHTISGMVDVTGDMPGVVRTFEECPAADMIIDFSHHTAVKSVLDAAIQRSCAAVVCTTGHTAEEIAMITEAAKHVPVFYSGNMSVGVALLCRLANQTARMFPEADVEIVEIHHKHKKDAPSGTAKMLFNAVKEARPEAEMVCGRSGMSPRTPGEVGIASLRMGEIVGIHEVHVSTGTQTITLKHEAHSRTLFAEGAICAAEFLIEQQPGMYNMDNMI